MGGGRQSRGIVTDGGGFGRKEFKANVPKVAAPRTDLAVLR